MNCPLPVSSYGHEHAFLNTNHPHLLSINLILEQTHLNNASELQISLCRYKALLQPSVKIQPSPVVLSGKQEGSSSWSVLAEDPNSFSQGVVLILHTLEEFIHVSP